jgi:signal transduction histidine kinase
VSDQNIVQGCWFSWPAIKDALRTEVADLGLLDNIDIIPVHDASKGDPARMLATLDAQLVASPPSLPFAAAGLTPVRSALLAAWIALAAAALAAAVLLRGVMALSERRAAFVSAVTHELRTPLTTFRMYSEMLAEGMVPDETQRRGYLRTLKTEADRLFHLIENVLSYARLERGRPSAARLTAPLEELLSPIVRRLAERAARDGMNLQYRVDVKAAEVIICTDAGALEQILVNLVDNACKYAAAATDRRIELMVGRGPQTVEISVGDHGPGISSAEAGRLFQPFTKSANQAAQTAPGVGLGLALSRRLARDLGGTLELTAVDSGAVFTLRLPISGERAGCG